MEDTFLKVGSQEGTRFAQTVTQSTSFFRLASQEGIGKAHPAVAEFPSPNIPVPTVGSAYLPVTFALTKLQLSLAFKLFPAF